MKIGFIGMGNMAFAIASGLMNCGFITGDNIYAYDINQDKLQDIEKQYGLHACKNADELVSQVDMVFLAIKPIVVESVISEVKESLSNKAVISIVAGYNYEKYCTLLSKDTRHLSVMPNTPAMVQQGMTLFEKDNSLTEEEFVFVKEMFESIGTVEILPSYLMKAGGAISGCGPAFMYMIIEAIADGGVLEGLPRDVAYRLASQTMIGSGMMQLQTKEHPGVLKDNVCSPGGITIRGVKTLEDAGVRSAFIEAIQKAK
ncbi:MAG: pyrroline-5-carboxylate reductase [Coprobacillaceae bacterium]